MNGLKTDTRIYSAYAVSRKKYGKIYMNRRRRAHAQIEARRLLKEMGR